MDVFVAKKSKHAPLPQMLLEPPLVNIFQKLDLIRTAMKLGKVTEAGDYTFNNECIAHENLGGGRFAPPPGQ